ncbi:mediator of RNA polymerase II transcription subunit 12-like protein isoform X2 [Tetranychus urticae]|uniref:mediator of RNA polymerase II transcription subunit 12-like protein isoform X2 n=1 Tax=Tetranychus urticae TaxID=32264 RepID=UPI00077B8548|nr:mediator of RNA polymerase II transcription subunit 12-like protein isoform X2 [Tetranychus urticae]
MAGKVSSWLYEKRSLKKPKLGPSDVYPQEPKQKEDELTAINVKQGFITCPTIQEEYGSSRNANITPNKFGAFFSALLSKKQELNTLQDTGRRKPQINPKDNIWLVTQRSKPAVDTWFRDLASGTKTLAQLSRKVPIFNKKEEIFLQLYEFQVPMFKANWFIKMSSAYSIALSETANKSKKRQVIDQSQEWTGILCRFLRDLYQKICEHYHGGNTSSVAPSSFSNSVSPSSANINIDVVQKQWQYSCQLARSLFEEGLLDKQEFLNWMLDILEKIKTADDSVMRVVVTLILQYVEDFTESELCSRKLAYQCAIKLNQLVSSYNSVSSLNSSNNSNSSISSPGPNDSSSSITNGQTVNRSGSPTTSPTSNSTTSVEPLIISFRDLLSCPHHRNIAIGLSAIIQIITLKCPTAMVWHGDGRLSPALNGSPLDHLPCPPSVLPMPVRPHNRQLREELRVAEDEIRLRSRAVENKWCSDRSQQTAPGVIINRLLNTLDSLDCHSFEKVEPNNSIETLYSAIFKNQSSSIVKTDLSEKSLKKIIAEDEPIIKLLCEWAVTTKRTGEHRALVVTKLLEKRQNELLAEKENEKPEAKEMETNLPNGCKNSEATSLINETPHQIYQDLLMSFLDTQAPVWDDKNPNPESKLAFSNLVLLFGELIRCDVFSHDAYMCALISRGQFANSPNASSLIPPISDMKITNKSEQPSLTNFVPNLPSATILPSLGGPTSNLVGSIDVNTPNRSSESSLPMFEPVTDPSGSTRSDLIGNWEHLEMDDAQLDSDLGKLLQHIKEGQQNNMNDQTDSVSSDKEDEAGSILANMGFGQQESGPKVHVQRHLLYTTHFPLPQDETTNHDCNQRHVLLYGVGKARDDARHTVKKTTKEILKLFSRKSSMDISEGAKIKKKESFSFETALSKFQSLAYFDQHVVTSSCAVTCIEMFEGVANGTSAHLPLIEAIAFLFDLMEMALNIHGLIDFCIQLLKEMPDVEMKLNEKCPILVGNYCTQIGLYITGVLYRYQSCLLVSQEETVTIFEGLYKLVRNVSNPADCSSAERCILCYLYDLYTNCSHIKSKYFDLFNSIGQKIKQNIHTTREPSSVKLSWNTTCMSEYINNPKIKIDVNHLQQLNENAHFRYSFVCNAVHAVSTAKDANRLNDLSILCAELSSRCPALGSEWLGVLKALCCSYKQNSGFSEVLAQVNVSDISLHDNIAVFTCILIARRCFSPQDFVIHCALPSLLAASPTGGGCQDAEAGARLTCHILLCFFRSSEPPLSSNTVFITPATTLYSLTSPGPSNLPPPVSNIGHNRSSLFVIKHPCDRYLLAAANISMKVEAVLTILKAILVLGDSTDANRETKPKMENSSTKELNLNEFSGLMNDEEFNDYDFLLTGNKSKDKSDGVVEAAGLNEFAKHVLRQISSQEWILERCLRDPDVITKQDVFLDPSLTPEQALQLLQMICNPKSHTLVDQDFEPKQQITRVFQNLDEWTIRQSWLQLQLMYAQCCTAKSPTDVGNWLDMVAKATIDFFQQASEESSKNGLFHESGKVDKQSSEGQWQNKSTRVWLVSPLISKLPSSVQGKILKVAANVLESGNWMSAGSNSAQNSYSYSKNKDRGFSQQKSSSSGNANNPSSLLSYPPFLALVLMCLRGKDEQRESLLNSLFLQLQQAVHDRDDPKNRVINIQEGLQLRLSLVGGMFDMIQKSTSLINDWAVLFVQLISYGVVETQQSYELFTTVLDMLAVLIHTTQSSETSESREETRKQYQNLIKKLKKEFAFDKVGLGVDLIKQLLPISKQQCEVITCEPMGSLIDTKGNKIAGFDSIDKKQGLQVAEKQKVSPWDLLEGHKNPGPLSWSWFGAVRIERKPLRGEENHNILAWHTHSFKQPTSYYLEHPPLPPEDVIEPSPVPTPSILNDIKPQVVPPPIIPPQPTLIPMSIQEDPIKRERDTPVEVSSPRASTAKKPKATRRKRTPKNATAAAGAVVVNSMTPPLGPANVQTPPMRQMTNYDNYVQPGPPQPAPPQPAPPPQWYSQQQPGPQPPPPQAGPMHQQNQQFFHPAPMRTNTNHYDRAPLSKSKAMLQEAIKNRQQPPNVNQGYMSQNSGPPPNQGMVPGPVPVQVPGPVQIPGPVPVQVPGPGPLGPGPGVPPNQGPPPQHMYQSRQMMMPRPMRTRQPQPPPQPPPQMAMQPQNPMQTNQMYQMAPTNQMVPQNVNMPPNSMHHMPVQSQGNYGGPPPNMNYNNPMQMTGMDQQMGGHGINQGYAPPPTNQQNPAMMNPVMRQQLHPQAGHHPQGQPGPPMPPSQPQQQPPQQQHHPQQQYIQQGQMNSYW